MKKLLALVLALVMTLSLCVVSSNAKFDDAADISYAEAADVMQAVGVFVGDGSGNFYPTQNLTRAQAAKVIAYLDLGESVAEALPAVQMFSDVPATHWAAKYIAYCADAEIVAGVGNGKFDPEAQVTGYQFAKMLLVVLGYDVAIEKLTGTNWSISTAKLVKENKLSKGFKGSFNDGLTREGAAQIAFNALKAYPVYSYTGYGLTLDNNGMLVTNSNGKAVKHPTGKDGKFDQNSDSLYADLYDGDLSYDGSDDNKLKDPAHSWTYKNAKVGTYADEPVLTYTTEWTWAQAKEDLAEAGVEIDTVNNNVHKYVTVYCNGVTGIEHGTLGGYTYDDGCEDDQTDMKEMIDDNSKKGGNGVVTKFYADSDDYLYRVTEAAYELAEVTLVTKDLASTKLVNEAKLYFGYGKKSDTTELYADKNTIGFGDVYADAEEGDMFLIAPELKQAEQGEESWWVASIVAPVVKEGKMTANGTKSCKLDGETYNKALYATSFAADTTSNVKLYCDEYGYAYGTGEIATASKLVLVTDLYQGLDKGKIVNMADVVYADGTTGSFKLATGKEINKNLEAGITYTYVEKNGAYELTIVEEAKTETLSKNVGYWYKLGADESVKAGAVKFLSLYFADDIKTVFGYKSNGSIKTVVADGVKKISAGSRVSFTLNSDGDINALFVEEKPSNTITGTDSLVYIFDCTAPFQTTDKNGDKVTVCAYTAYVNGKEIEEFYVQDGGDGAVGKFYELEDDIDLENGYILEDAYDNSDEDVKTVAGDVDSEALDRTKIIEIDDLAVKVNSSTEFVDVCDTDGYIVKDLGGLIEALRAMDDKHNDKGVAKVAVIYDADTLVASYVYVGAVGYGN